MTTLLSLLILTLAALPFILILKNLSHFDDPAINKKLSAKHFQVSVLIPARDEATIIGKTIDAVLVSQQIDLELIVLDDNSSDQTANIVQQKAEIDQRCRLIRGTPLPTGWCGKQHACYQLAQQATHDLLLFVDADVIIHPDTIVKTCDFLQNKSLDLLSGIPQQITKSWSETLIIPLIHFILLGFLPMFMKDYKTDPKFSAGCGQFILVRKTAYWKIGGHANIRQSWHDGINLTKQFRLANFNTAICDLTQLCQCRMYKNFKQVWMGFTKNATEGMAGKISIFAWTFILGVGQLLPVLMLCCMLYQSHIVQATIAGVALALNYCSRLILARRFKQSMIAILFHPISVALILSIQWYAWLQERRGKTNINWKGRVKPAQNKNITKDYR